jgi:hypothetical protein
MAIERRFWSKLHRVSYVLHVRGSLGGESIPEYLPEYPAESPTASVKGYVRASCPGYRRASILGYQPDSVRASQPGSVPASLPGSVWESQSGYLPVSLGESGGAYLPESVPASLPASVMASVPARVFGRYHQKLWKKRERCLRFHVIVMTGLGPRKETPLRCQTIRKSRKPQGEGRSDVRGDRSAGCGA